MLILESKLRQGTALVLLAVVVLAGCAGQKLHNSGMSLVQDGHVEEGLSKLEQASIAAPDNVQYRKDLLRSREMVITRLISKASAERAAGHTEGAQVIYRQILKIDPNNHIAAPAIESMQMEKRHDALLEEARDRFAKGDSDGARSALKPVFLENPKQGPATLLLRQIDEQETKVQMAEPALNGQFKKPVTLQFRDANVKMVFEAISRTSGVNILLDKDIKSDLKTSIFVKDVSVEDALDLILMQNQLEKKILSNNTLYIYPNTAAKLKDYQDLKIRSFHLVNADPKQILTMIKTLLKTKDIFIHEKTNSIVMRDTPDAIHLAEKMIADQDIAEPEVMLEVEVLEVSRARLTDIGVQFPNKLSLTPLQSVVSAPSSTGVAATASQLTLGDLRNITKNSLGINVPTLTLNAMLQDSDTNILSSPRLRVRNREKAKIMIGERVPMITNSITPVSTGTPVVTGSVTYQDVGLKLDVEPEIHLDNEVTIKIGLEVSSLGLAVSNASGSDVYRVGTRNTMTTLRLKDGETQILGGLISDQDTNTVDKVPLLGQIPILGHLFASDSGNKSKTEIVLSITPHIVGNFKLADAREMEYWSGTESGLRSSQLVLKPIGVAVLGNNGAVPQRPAPAAAPTASPAPAESDMNSAATAAANKTRKSAQNTAESQTHSPDPRTVVLAWQGPNKAKVGDKIIISLNTPSSQGVKKIELSVGFDPSVFKAVDAVEGDSMKKNKEPSSFNKTIDQAGGEISVEISGSGMSTASSVVSLILEAVTESAETLLSLNSIALSGDNKATLTPTVPDPYAVTVAQ